LDVGKNDDDYDVTDERNLSAAESTTKMSKNKRSAEASSTDEAATKKARVEQVETATSSREPPTVAQQQAAQAPNVEESSMGAADPEVASSHHPRLVEGKQYLISRRIDEPTEWDPTGFLFDLEPGDVVTCSVIPKPDDEENAGWVVAEHRVAGQEPRVGWIEEDALES